MRDLILIPKLGHKRNGHAGAAGPGIDECLDIAGIKGDQRKPNLDGRSLLPALKRNASETTPRAIFWRMGPQHAVRYGDWKLVVRRGASPELYNLKDDIAESKNLANSEPERLKELQTLYADWDKSNIAPLWRRSEGAD